MIQDGNILVPGCRRGMKKSSEVKERGKEGGKLLVTHSKLSDTYLSPLAILSYMVTASCCYKPSCERSHTVEEERVC